MTRKVRIYATTTAIAALCVLSAEAVAQCIHPWAMPGRYTVSGQLQDKVQRTTAYLTKGCRVNFNLPGVASGGPVAQDGACVRFTFKVRNVAEVFSARWCDSYAVVPWRGRDVRVDVTRASMQ